MMSLKIIFAGTPEFAAPCLQALIDSKHQVIVVYTQPDRRAGRGQQIIPSPVKALAVQHHIPVYQPLTFKENATTQQLKDLHADVMVVVAYGLLLPKTILTATRYGAINVHPSLLPRWRGATPIQSAILAGDNQTGVSIIQLTAKMDAGPILLQTLYPISEQATSADLHDQLAKIGADALIHTLDLLMRQALTPKIQDEQQVTYTSKISKNDALIDWRQSAIQLARMVRAYNPWPIAFCYYQGKPLRIWQSQAVDATINHAPGTLVSMSSAGLDVATGSGILRLLTIQTPGNRFMSAADFIHGQKQHLVPGVTRFEIGYT